MADENESTIVDNADATVEQQKVGESHEEDNVEKQPDDAAKESDAEGKSEAKDDSPAFSAKDIELPEGTQYDETVGSRFEAVVAELGLDGSAAQKLAQLYFELVGESQGKMDEALKAAQKASAEAAAKQLADEEAGWLKEAKADKEIGGHNWKKTAANVDRALRTLKGDNFAQLMRSEGFDNHPEVLRFLSRVGESLAEDSMLSGGASHGRKSDAEVFYGKSR